MAQPNELWQSDFIYWRLVDGTDVEVLNWLDDHSRYLLSCAAHQPVTGDAVVAVFLDLVEAHGPPASTLTDNGSVYTSRFTGARTLTELQQQLDEFTEHYNEHRPHRALKRTTPAAAYRATPKAIPATSGHAHGHHRLRYDRLDPKGRMTLRRAGRMHHLGIGATHARKRVLAFADDHHITVADLATGEVLSTHQIEPNKTYWRNQQREPGRWPGSQKVRPMSRDT